MRYIALLSVLTLAVGCSDSDSTSASSSDTGSGIELPTTTGDASVSSDSSTPPVDTGPITPPDASDSADGVAPGDGAVVPGGFGAPCEGNPDCLDGWCVEGTTGFVCTKTCQEDCPAGWSCKGVSSGGADLVFLCLPRVRKLCVPCTDDSQCNEGACLEIDDDTMCGYQCDTSDECPDGFGCQPDPTGERIYDYCQPLTKSCSCNKEINIGQRSCQSTSDLGGDLGVCFGVQTCDTESGWSECSASAPRVEDCDGLDNDCDGLIDEGLTEGEACTNDVAGVGSCDGVSVCAGGAGWQCQGAQPEAEICDFKDNDCDGDVDEDFKSPSGIYGEFLHCGTCNASCALGFPNADTTNCQVTGNSAQCVVELCEEGFLKLNDFQCIPNIASICQPCTTDANCLGDDAACVQLNEGSFCGKACTSTGDCPAGYSCSAVGAAANQCVPTSGSCSCDGTNPDLVRACSETFDPPDPESPSYTCKGFEQCTGNGWGVCELPSEACDNLDNNCDGSIDETFRNGAGQYHLVEHCGGCGISCLALNVPHAVPSCDLGGPVPACSFACANGWFDVNGLSDDGCECQPQAGDDLAGDGVDSNCDGIDGDLAFGVFVAKNGSDAPGNGSIDAPLLTIEAGLQRAFVTGKRDVYVATGVYSESIILRKGVGLFGGYSSDFFEHDTILFETAIIGQDATAQRPATVTAINVGGAADSRVTALDGFTIFGVNAANDPGSNSYGLYLGNCGVKLLIRSNRIFGGAGGNGTAGIPGGPGDPGVPGVPGEDSEDVNSYIPNGNRTCGFGDSLDGGAGGQRTCGAVNVSGGNGGRSECPIFNVDPGVNEHGKPGFSGRRVGHRLSQFHLLHQNGHVEISLRHALHIDTVQLKKIPRSR